MEIIKLLMQIYSFIFLFKPYTSRVEIFFDRAMLYMVILILRAKDGSGFLSFPVRQFNDIHVIVGKGT